MVPVIDKQGGLGWGGVRGGGEYCGNCEVLKRERKVDRERVELEWDRAEREREREREMAGGVTLTRPRTKSRDAHNRIRIRLTLCARSSSTVTLAGSTPNLPAHPRWRCAGLRMGLVLRQMLVAQLADQLNQPDILQATALRPLARCPVSGCPQHRLAHRPACPLPSLREFSRSTIMRCHRHIAPRRSRAHALRTMRVWCAAVGNGRPRRVPSHVALRPRSYASATSSSSHAALP